MGCGTAGSRVKSPCGSFFDTFFLQPYKKRKTSRICFLRYMHSENAILSDRCNLPQGARRLCEDIRLYAPRLSACAASGLPANPAAPSRSGAEGHGIKLQEVRKSPMGLADLSFFPVLYPHLCPSAAIMCNPCSRAPITAARFSRAAFSDPGRFSSRLLPLIPATARDSIAGG